MLKPLTEQVVEKSKDMMNVCMKELGNWENIVGMDEPEFKVMKQAFEVIDLAYELAVKQAEEIDEINNKLDKLLAKVEKLN